MACRWDNRSGYHFTPPLPNYDFIPLWEDPILAVLSDKNPLADHPFIDLKELVEYPFIAPNEDADETINRIMDAESLSPNIRFRIKGDIATLSMVEQNLGVSLMPKLTCSLKQCAVTIRPLKQRYVRELGICLQSKKHASPATLAFICEVRDYIENEWPTHLSEL